MAGSRRSALRVILPWLTHNLGLKVISLLSGIALFAIFSGADDVQRSIFVEVVPIHAPESSARVLISEVPERVKVTLRGNRSLLRSASEQTLDPIKMDLRNTDMRFYAFDPVAFDIPQGLSIVRITPDTVPLSWATRIERNVGIEARLVGTPRDGLYVDLPVQIDPSEIMVRGPEDEVQSIRVMLTEGIDIRGLGAKAYERWVQLEHPPPHTQQVTGTLVRVSFEIKHIIIDRVLNAWAIRLPEELRSSTESVRLRLRGPQRHLDQLDAKTLVVSPDLSELDPKRRSGSVPLRVVEKPATISVLELSPKRIRVTRR